MALHHHLSQGEHLFLSELGVIHIYRLLFVSMLYIECCSYLCYLLHLSVRVHDITVKLNLIFYLLIF